MSNTQIVIILFGLMYLTLVLYTRRKGDFEEFSVASRGLGVFLIFASMSASYLGPAFTLGLTREGYSDGLFLFIIGALLIVEHRLVRPDNLTHINIAFFHMNSIISVLLFIGVLIQGILK